MLSGSVMARTAAQCARLVAGVLVLATSVLSAAAADKPSRALAVGWSYDHPTPGKAEAIALSYCKRKCRIVIAVHAACAAVSVGEGGASAAKWAATREKAEAEAKAACGRHSANCKTRAWMCSPKGYGAIALETPAD